MNAFPHPHFSEGLDGDELAPACVREAERLHELASYLASDESAPWLARHLRDSLGVLVAVLERLDASTDTPPLSQPASLVASTPLLHRRLSDLSTILFQPERALTHIDDYRVERRVRSGRFSSCNQLFLALACLEAGKLGTVFQGLPEDTIRSYLCRQFRVAGWQWPRTIEAWRDFLEAWQAGRTPTEAEQAAPVITPDTLPETLRRRVAAVWSLCFEPERVIGHVRAYDAALARALTSSDPVLMQEHKTLCLALAAIEEGTGRGKPGGYAEPYRAMRTGLIKAAEALGCDETPQGLYGWRLWFIERGWDEPGWMGEGERPGWMEPTCPHHASLQNAQAADGV